MYRITTQKQLRKEFWLAFPSISRKKITNYSGNGTMYCTDTRCTFNDWLDMLNKGGVISQKLANSATL